MWIGRRDLGEPDTEMKVIPNLGVIIVFLLPLRPSIHQQSTTRDGYKDESSVRSFSPQKLIRSGQDTGTAG